MALDAKNGDVRLSFSQAMFVLRDIVTVLVLPITVWVVLTVVSNSERLAAIEASRFTANDGMQVWQAISAKPDREELRAEIAELKADVAEIRQILEARR